MLKFINDPREMAIRPESGLTLEEDNRIETMYHWYGKVLDLCDLPPEEYMKPMIVITSGSSGGYDPETTQKINDIKDIVTAISGDVNTINNKIGDTGEILDEINGEG